MNFNYLLAHSDCGGDITDLIDALVLKERLKLRITLVQIVSYQLLARLNSKGKVTNILQKFYDEGIWDYSKIPPTIIEEQAIYSP